jgi:hypothetical protein
LGAVLLNGIASVLTIDDPETLHVTDTPLFPFFIDDPETVHTTDMPTEL